MKSKWIKIKEGKTKIIRQLRYCSCIVKVESKDTITAGDGVKKDVIERKGILANNTTCNVFELLERNGIETHYIERFSERSFLAYKCKMIPIEVVIRKIATGSYLKRHPEVPRGEVFKDLVVEFFLKDDRLHDPIIVIEGSDSVNPALVKNDFFVIAKLYKAKEPLSKESFLGTIDLWKETGVSGYNIESLVKQAKRVFRVLEGAFKKLGIVLWDLKIEFGVREKDKKFVIADVIDNDSWRIRDLKGNQLDKQIYREGGSLQKVKTLYERVSEITDRFTRL